MNRENEGPKPTVLIVDDLPNNIQIVAAVLKKENCTIAAAPNGKKALEMVRERKPDLVILDIMMPDMDGYEVCRTLKASPETRDIPVIFITARSEPNDLVKGFELGAVDYVTKPFQPNELLARTRSQLELKRQRDQIKAMSERYQKLSDERGQLIHVLSHDLANPVGSLLEAMKLIADNPALFPELKNDMLKTAEHSWDLIRLVKTTAALDEDLSGLDIVPTNLLSTVNDSAFMVRRRLEDKGLTLKIDIDPALEVKVEPVSFVNSVLNNILTNAIKFTPRGGEIIVSARRDAENVVLTARDTGIGMPPVILEKLFSFSAKTTRRGTEDEEGTGFGMPLLKKFIDSYGGSVIVRSNEKTTPAAPRGTEIAIALKSADGASALR